jgi:hypothetical protein
MLALATVDASGLTEANLEMRHIPAVETTLREQWKLAEEPGFPKTTPGSRPSRPNRRISSDPSASTMLIDRAVTGSQTGAKVPAGQGAHTVN